MDRSVGRGKVFVLSHVARCSVSTNTGHYYKALSNRTQTPGTHTHDGDGQSNTLISRMYTHVPAHVHVGRPFCDPYVNQSLKFPENKVN